MKPVSIIKKNYKYLWNLVYYNKISNVVRTIFTIQDEYLFFISILEKVDKKAEKKLGRLIQFSLRGMLKYTEIL